MKYIARTDRSPEARQVGEPIQLALNPADYTDSVEILSPGADGERVTRIQASPEQLESEKDDATATKAGPLRLTATFRDTDDPGIYTVRLLGQNQVSEDRLIAYNVLPREGDLQVATTPDLRKRLGASTRVTIQEFGQLEWVQGKEAGSEIRQWLLWSLLALLIAEQALAYRLTYHQSSPTSQRAIAGRRVETSKRMTTSA